MSDYAFTIKNTHKLQGGLIVETEISTHHSKIMQVGRILTTSAPFLMRRGNGATCGYLFPARPIKITNWLRFLSFLIIKNTLCTYNYNYKPPLAAKSDCFRVSTYDKINTFVFLYLVKKKYKYKDRYSHSDYIINLPLLMSHTTAIRSRKAAKNTSPIPLIIIISVATDLNGINSRHITTPIKPIRSEITYNNKSCFKIDSIFILSPASHLIYYNYIKHLCIFHSYMFLL